MSGRFKKTRFYAIVLALVVLLPAAGAARQSDYDLSRMEALSWVILQVKRDYVDPSRVKPARMLKSVLETIEQRIPEIEIKLHDGRATVQVGDKKESFDLGSPATVWEMNYTLRGPMKFIAENLPEDTDPKDVEFAAIDGMLSTLDPHSNLLPPELFREMTLKTTGEFGGLGIRITIRDGALTIISPLPHTPAARLGLRAGDQIVRIGDQSTVNMPLDEAVSMLRGKPGTKVTIWVMRKGWSEPRKYVITRERIQVHSVESRLLEGRVGYIQIQDFGKHTGADVSKHLSELRKKAGGLKGLIIDLRNNSGGLMKAAIKTADLFLDSGVIVATVSYSEDSTEEEKVQKAREERRAREDGTDTELPLVVLVNSGSASASEILAGALKNLDRALVMGQQTFGKGTVQILNDRVPQSISGACLKLTVAEYLIPGDISIQEVGVTPDIKLVPMVLDGDDLQAFLERDHFREKDIPAHLTKKHPGRFKPAVVLKYVEEPEPEPKEGEEPPLEEPAFKQDFPITLARKILLKVRTPRGSAMLDEAQALLEQVSRQQQQQMFRKLSERGIDWTASSEADWAGDATVTFRLLDEKDRPVSELSADGKAVLELTVRNGSKTPINRLWAESKSKFSLLDKREFVFGKVTGGGSRSWKVRIGVPRGTLTRQDEVRFVFHCDCRKPPDPLNVTVKTKGLKRPRMLVSWWLDDAGNGDGLIEPGETITMNLAVTNGGKGKAFKVKGLLKNEAGRDLFLKRGKGRFQIDGIDPGQTATGSFVFDVRPDARRDYLPVELSVWDTDLAISHTAGMKLPVRQKAAGKVVRGKWRLRVRRPGVLRAGPSGRMPVCGRVTKGTLRADRKFEGFYRVVTAGGPAGWIPAGLVRPTAGRGPRAKILPAPQLTPPLVKIERAPLLVEGDQRQAKILLDVSDADSPLRDVALWVGDEKVLLVDGSEIRNNHLKLEAAVKLKPGPNLVTVIAREGKKFASRSQVIITRAGGIDWREKEEEKLADGADGGLILE